MKKKRLKLRDVLEAMNERFNLVSLQLSQTTRALHILQSDVHEVKDHQEDIAVGVFETQDHLNRSH